MGRKPTVMKRASYRAGVAWIAWNDNAGDDNPLAAGANGQEVRERIAGYISTLLLADLFGADPDRVAADIYRERARYMAQDAAAAVYPKFLSSPAADEACAECERSHGPHYRGRCPHGEVR